MLFVILVLAMQIGVANAQAVVYQSFPPLGERIQLACGFLRTLYNPALGLVRETNNSQVYHIASDNLLAQKALESCDPQAAASIRTAISMCCENGHSLMHEALLNITISFPIKTANVYLIASSVVGRLFNGVTASDAGGDYIVFREVHNGTGTLSPHEYADVAAYTALEYHRRGNQTGFSLIMENLNIMFDGQGLVDEPYQNGSPSEDGIYQTYKLALYIYIQSKHYGVYPGLIERLLRMQDPDGGFHSGYDQNGTYAGTLANAETTSIAIIILNQLTTQQTPPFPFPFYPITVIGQILLYIAIAIIAGTAIVLGYVFWEETRKKRSRQSLKALGSLSHILFPNSPHYWTCGIVKS